jgi:2-aminoadipate transaminase
MLVFPQGFDTLPFVREGIKRKVISVPGSAFMPDPDQPCNLVRLNYSLPSEEQIIQGIRILGKLSYEMLG